MSVKGMLQKKLELTVRCMRTKGNNFCDFLFAYLDEVVFPKLGLFLIRRGKRANLGIISHFTPLKHIFLTHH